MVCFRRGEGRKKTEWKWKDQKIEEVKEFKYLGFVVKSNKERKVKEKKQYNIKASMGIRWM